MATTATTSAPTTTARIFPLKYFMLAFAFTWALWVPAALEARGLISPLPRPATFLGAFGPLAAAVVVTVQEGGRAGLSSLLGRVVRWRVAPVWYVVAILGPLVIMLGAIALHMALGGQPPSLGLLIGVLPTLVFVFIYMMVTVALGEEVGWRGYALPALQARYSALLASLILGVMWALWHLPVFFNPDTFYSNLPFALWLAYIVPFAILITWVFNSTGGSVLMAIFFHAVLNATGELWKTIPEYAVKPPTAAEAVAQNVHVNLMGAIVLWVAAVVVVLVYGAANLSRRPKQELAAPSGEFQPRVQ
ncbi:MAG TPA: type II CAAX endopeptidase family protein [Chloroflexota bacterium]|nr:type II CAAX endopeptidase family protein [Chloroflexota bacterium]